MAEYTQRQEVQNPFENFTPTQRYRGPEHTNRTIPNMGPKVGKVIGEDPGIQIAKSLTKFVDSGIKVIPDALKPLIKEDIEIQTARAANGLLPTEDATRSGAKANALIYTQNLVNKSVQELEYELKNGNMTQEEFEKSITERTKSITEQAQAHYSQLFDDKYFNEDLYKISGTLMAEKMPGLVASKRADELNRLNESNKELFSTQLANIDYSNPQQAFNQIRQTSAALKISPIDESKLLTDYFSSTIQDPDTPPEVRASLYNIINTDVQAPVYDSKGNLVKVENLPALLKRFPKMKETLTDLSKTAALNVISRDPASYLELVDNYEKGNIGSGEFTRNMERIMIEKGIPPSTASELSFKVVASVYSKREEISDSNLLKNPETIDEHNRIISDVKKGKLSVGEGIVALRQLGLSDTYASKKILGANEKYLNSSNKNNVDEQQYILENLKQGLPVTQYSKNKIVDAGQLLLAQTINSINNEGSKITDDQDRVKFIRDKTNEAINRVSDSLRKSGVVLPSLSNAGALLSRLTVDDEINSDAKQAAETLLNLNAANRELVISSLPQKDGDRLNYILMNMSAGDDVKNAILRAEQNIYSVQTGGKLTGTKLNDAVDDFMSSGDNTFWFNKYSDNEKDAFRLKAQKMIQMFSESDLNDPKKVDFIYNFINASIDRSMIKSQSGDFYVLDDFNVMRNSTGLTDKELGYEIDKIATQTYNDHYHEMQRLGYNETDLSLLVQGRNLVVVDPTGKTVNVVPLAKMNSNRNYYTFLMNTENGQNAGLNPSTNRFYPIKSYEDTKSGSSDYEIGYGTKLTAEQWRTKTITAGGRTYDFSNGLSKEDAYNIMVAEVEANYRTALKTLGNPVIPEEYKIFFADLTYNGGPGLIGPKTTIGRHIKNGDYQAALLSGLKIINTKKNGQPVALKGLLKRRVMLYNQTAAAVGMPKIIDYKIEDGKASCKFDSSFESRKNNDIPMSNVYDMKQNPDDLLVSENESSRWMRIN